MFSKRVVLSFAAVVVLGLGTFGLYWYWTRTVDYAMSQIVSAALDRDLETFKKYVDVQGLCSRLVDDISASAMEQQPASSKAEALGQTLGAGLVEMMKPPRSRRFAAC